MNPGAMLLTELRQAGLTVDLLGDRIVVSPAERITNELRERIRYRREEALSHLVLESRIRAMAIRWNYSDAELAESLAGAALDPPGWGAWVEHDEMRFGPGEKPVLPGHA